MENANNEPKFTIHRLWAILDDAALRMRIVDKVKKIKSSKDLKKLDKFLDSLGR